MTETSAGSKRKREVQVVVCPSAFPDFSTVGGSTSRRRERQRNSGNKNRANSSDPSSKIITASPPKGPELDVQETIREVHKFGATAFTGNQAKQHQASEYERITGRSQKRQKIPTKILVGMRKKALKREERQKQELKESGVVSHHSFGGEGNKKKKRKVDKDEKVAGPGVVRGVFGSNKARNKGDRRKMSPKSFGPAPSVGFMTKGMLKVKQPGR